MSSALVPMPADVAEPFTEMHHLVSKWYQRNFADPGRRVTVLNARTGETVAKARAVRRNFVAAGYNTYISPEGTVDAPLEREFSKIESHVAARIKPALDAGQTPEKAAVAAHFALHLVRSEGFGLASARVVDDLRRNWIPKMARDATLPARYEAEYGNTPTTRDLELFAERVLDEQEAAKRLHISGMVGQYNRQVEFLSRFYLQVISSDSLGMGFALADIPVVHANTKTGQYGFRDGLALPDADLIIGPLKRFTAVAMSYRPIRPVTVKTPKGCLQTINAVFVRAALREVACHPDDARELAWVCQHVDRLPPGRLLYP